MIMLLGVGWQSKSAMAVISCFFPIALSVAAGMRGIDRVLIRVGRSFRASVLQMVTKVYLPAMRAPIVNGIRLGFGVAVIGTLLAETKLSNQGLGYHGDPGLLAVQHADDVRAADHRVRDRDLAELGSGLAGRRRCRAGGVNRVSCRWQR